MTGILYIVATPIGNLEDITLRAIRILEEADIILCEDTRQSLKLLNSLKIKKKLVSFHEHSKNNKIAEIIDELERGKYIALITDSGTPGVSDPGGKLVAETVGKGIKVVPIPGPSALTTMVSISGIGIHQFIYYGFLPQKKGRLTLLKKAVKEDKPGIFYESPYRIKKLLNEIADLDGDREVIVGRELTKKFEEVIRGKISEIEPKINPKGEFVVILDRKKDEK